MCGRIASVNRSIRCGHDVRGEYIVIEPDICHAKKVSLEAGFEVSCNTERAAKRCGSVDRSKKLTVEIGGRNEVEGVLAWDSTYWRRIFWTWRKRANSQQILSKFSAVRMSSPLESDLESFASSSALYGWKTSSPLAIPSTGVL